MTIIQHEKKLFEHRDLGNGFVGHVPANINLLEATPSMRWSGAKIPLSVWKEIVAFFQWSYAETKSETQVRLLLNTDTGEYKAHAFPQKYGTGMTAKELSDNEDYSNQLNSQMSDGNWIKFGTVHHHCSAGAFQSGTDSADETEMGIHITLGNIGDARHSIHGRVSLTIPGSLNPDGTTATKASHAYYSARFSDWFEIPDLGIPVSDSIREEVAKHVLCTPEPDESGFPELWAQNLIKESPKSAYQPAGFSQHEQDSWLKYGDYTLPDYSSAFHNHSPTSVSPPRRKPHKLDEQDRLEEFSQFMEQLMEFENISIATVHGLMQIGEAHYLSDKEWDLFNRIDREMTRLNICWDDYTEAF